MSASALDFSIVLPLRDHRGRALEAVRGWARQQTYARERTGKKR